MSSHFHIKDALDGASPGSLLRSPNTDARREPLARLVGEEAADAILNWAGNVGLCHMDARELASVAGIDPELAERLVAARQLHEVLEEPELPILRCSRDVIQALPRGLRNLETEVLLACALNAQSELLSTVVLARGGGSQTALTPKDVFVPMLRLAASGLVIVHNHPSRGCDPSDEDVKFTNRLFSMGLALGIRVMDHLIVAGRHVFSFADTGLMPIETEIDELDEDDQ